MDNPNTRQKFEHIIRQLESLNPSIRLHKKEIERRLCKLSRTPDHPPYASMIQKAISELNDQGGSSEEAISKFIETEYDRLPIAHASYLRYHLQKLITKGEIVYTSANRYLLPSEYSDSVQKLKGQEQLRKFRKGRLKGRRLTVKGVQSQQKQTIEESQEHNQVCEKISEGAEEQKMIEDEQYKEAEEYDLMQEQKNRQQMELNVWEIQVEGNAGKEGHQSRNNHEVTEIEIQEVQQDFVTEEPCHSEQNNEKTGNSNLIQDPESEAREEQVESADIRIEKMAEEISSQEQCQLLCKTIEGTAETQNLEEESHQVRTSGKITEKVVQEVREVVVIEEAPHREQRSETPVESNPIRDIESEGRDAQGQVADKQIETMEEQQGRCFELSCEEKKLQELRVEVCHRIMDLSNSLAHFIKKKKEDKTTASTQYDTANLEDHFGSSHLTKEELMQLLKKTYKIGAKLNDIIDMDVLKHNNLKLKTGMKQKNSLENHPQQTKETCLQGSESSLVHDCQSQQLEICGQPEGSESQPRIILASDSVPTSMMGFERSCQIELPTCKRPSEVQITVLEGSSRDQNKLVKLCDQLKALSTDHQQEITLMDVATPPESKLGQEQQPEALFEERPTEHELTQQQMQGQKLQEQLPPLSQMLQEQCVQRKKMPDQQQLRKLRPRGPRPSKHETVLTTVEVHHDLKAKLKQNSEALISRRLQVQGSQTEVEISQSTEQTTLNRKRQQKRGTKAVVKIFQPTDRQVNHHGQIKQLKSQPTTIGTVDSASTSQQQTQEQSYSQSESVLVNNTEESLPLGNMQSEQVKLQCQHCGRPPKVKPHAEPQNHEEQQKVQAQESPSKKKTDADASMEGSMFLDHHKHEEQQQKRALERPSKWKTNADASMEGSLLSGNQNHDEQRPI